MKLKFLPVVILTLFIFTKHINAQGLVGNGISTITEPKFMEIEFTPNSDFNFSFTFMGLSTAKVQVDWGNGDILEYSVAGITPNIDYLYSDQSPQVATIYTAPETFSSLSFNSMGITAVDFVSAQSRLTQILFKYNPIESLDFSALGTTLVDLTIEGQEGTGSELTNLTLSANTGLKYLILPNNSNLETLNLSANEELLKINASNCAKLSDPDMFVNNTKLAELNLSGCNFTALNLPAMPDLTDLRCLNMVSGLTGTLDLSGMSSLSILGCSNNELTAIKLHSGISSMNTLLCDYNRLNFRTFPRVSATTYDFSNQKDTFIPVEGPAYTIDMDSFLPDLSGTNNPGNQAAPTYSVRWKASLVSTGGTSAFFNAAQENAFMVKTGNSVFFNETFRGVYKLPFATITSNAYPGVTFVTTAVDLVGSSVGIGEESSDQVSVYPNPFAEELMVKDAEGGRFELTNIHGVMVYSAMIGSSNEQLSVGHLEPGIYISKLIHNGNTSVAKLVKK